MTNFFVNLKQHLISAFSSNIWTLLVQNVIRPPPIPISNALEVKGKHSIGESSCARKETADIDFVRTSTDSENKEWTSLQNKEQQEQSPGCAL